jgi:hypothetical protein
MKAVKGVWPLEYAVKQRCEGFESNFNCTKLDAKAGSFFIQDGTGLRYFLIRHTGDSKWDAVRIKENKKARTCECPFCNTWKSGQGINNHMKSCPQNNTETRKKKKEKVAKTWAKAKD